MGISIWTEHKKTTAGSDEDHMSPPEGLVIYLEGDTRGYTLRWCSSSRRVSVTNSSTPSCSGRLEKISAV